MIKRILIFVAIFVGALSLSVMFFIYNRHREINDLEKQGNVLVRKIEAYKKAHHNLPNSLEDLGLKLPDDYPIYYNTYSGINPDSSTYRVSFQIWFFESRCYDSNTKIWEDLD